MVKIRWIAIAIGWLTVAVVSRVNAQTATPGQGLMPRGVSGYTVTVEEDWLECRQGMYPVRVTVETNPPVAVANDEPFTVSLSNIGYQNGPCVVTAPLVISAGSRSSVVDIYMPVIWANASYGSNVMVEKGGYDGRFGRGDLLVASLDGYGSSYDPLPNLLLISSSSPAPSSHQWVCYQDRGEKMMAIGSAAASPAPPVRIPSLDQRQAMFQGKESADPLSPSFVRSNIDGSGGLLEMQPSRLPMNWIGLTGVDQILISFDDLSLICTNGSIQRANLEKWISAGGALIVFDTGPKFREADKIWERVLGESRSIAASRNGLTWTVPGDDLMQAKKLLPSSAGITDYYNQYAYQERDQENTLWFGDGEIKSWIEKADALSEFENPSLFPESALFGVSGYLNGAIFAVSDDMSRWKGEDWRALHNAIMLTGGSVSEQIGFSAGEVPMRRFGIPGVGKPPVTMFQVLIGLFLFVSGPVTLIVLKRMQQLQFLFVVVPLMSAVVCVSLFMSAVLVDGSKQWGRAQTVTSIDHRTGLAISHARAAYYSGRNPGDYQFPEDTFVVGARIDSRSRSFYRFGLDRLAISGGDIRARMPHEINSVGSRRVTEGLILKRATEGADGVEVSPSIQNRLGADVALVVFRDAEGSLFIVSDLKKGQTAPGEKMSEPVLGMFVGDSVRRLTPQDFESLVSQRNQNYGIYYGQGSDDSWGEEDRVVGILRQNKVLDLLEQPNSYIAILEELPLVSDLIEPVQYKLQMHVVRGQW